MPMPKLSPEWQRPGDHGSARPDNHTTSRRCSGVSLVSIQRRLATCFVTIGPWGVSRDQRRGGAGAARCHDLREGLCHRSTGFTPKKLGTRRQCELRIDLASRTGSKGPISYHMVRFARRRSRGPPRAPRADPSTRSSPPRAGLSGTPKTSGVEPGARPREDAAGQL